MWAVFALVFGAGLAYVLGKRKAANSNQIPILPPPPATNKSTARANTGPLRTGVLDSSSPAYNAALMLKGVLAVYGAGSSQASASGRVFAAAAGVGLPPGGVGYVESVRQAAAALLGDDPRTWPNPSTDLIT